MHRMRLAVLLFACSLAACQQAPSSQPGESPAISNRLAEAAGNAMRTVRTNTEDLPEPVVIAGKLAQIGERVTDAGMLAAAAWPYVQARECGASDAQLLAYKRLVRAQLQEQPDFSARDFQAEFDAGVRLMSRRQQLDGGPLTGVQRDGSCRWALDVIAGSGG